ncbi:MAG: hypothetical protein IKT46_09920 [Clostridia bacterium]|nr:hypothetical protein [Clostridia bacterium]
MAKKKQDATEYSKKAMFENPAVSATDHTGYSQQAELDAAEAQSLADLMDAAVKEERPHTNE